MRGCSQDEKIPWGKMESWSQFMSITIAISWWTFYSFFFCLLSRQYLCASFSKYIKFEKQCRVIYDKHMLLLIFSSVTEKCRLTEGRKSISLLHYRISIPYIYVWEWRIILPFSKIAWQSFSCEFAVDKNWCLYIDKHSWTINPWEWGKFVF